MVGTLLVAFAALAGSAGSAPAATLQSIGNFSEPVYVTSDPGNPNRLFVVQRAGRIMQVENGAVSEFANLEAQVSCCTGEQGLLSIALAPDFAASGRLFAYYTGRETPWPEIHVAELRANGQTATLARDLLRIPHPNQVNHYGGQLQFGPENLLFIGTGDGGGIDDSEHNAQKLEGEGALLGKILRIGVDSSGVLPYTVPAGNPFATAPSPYNTIFAYGLRNPYRFSFDRQTHDLVIGDVGQSAREEIDWAPAANGVRAGANYGWNCREGLAPGPATDPGCTPPPPAGTFVDPVLDYLHVGSRQAVIGGYVARDPSLPELGGRYLYGDLGDGEVHSLVLSEGAGSDRSEGLNVNGLDSFGEDSCGRLYAVSRSGPVYRLVGPSPNTCAPPVLPITQQLAPSTVGIRAVTRRIKRNGRAQLTVWVSPCSGRRGDPVRLLRGNVRLGSRRLDRACTARFLPRVTHAVRFRADVRSDDVYAEATSRMLGVHVYRPKKGATEGGGRLHVPAGVGRR